MRCISFVLVLTIGLPAGATALAADLTRIERKPGREPNYDSQPRYCLLLFGAEDRTPVWIVEDGETLYVDRNANGDLTDDGPPINPSERRQLRPDKWDYDYVLDRITPPNGLPHTKFRVARWNYDDEADRYSISVELNGKIPMYAGWFGSFWGDTPGKASIIHFGAAVTPRLLREKEFVVDSGQRRLSLAFTAPGLGDGSQSRLSIDAIPKDAVPRVHIDWPVAKGRPALTTSHELTERCCYWEFYDTKFHIPHEAVEGTATVTIEWPSGVFPLELTTNQIAARVRLTRSNPTEE